jgi:hypothetical protein
MEHHMMGPLWGNVVIITLAGIVTLGCVIAAFRMLIHPGEGDPRHPKYSVLRQPQRSADRRQDD